MDITFDNYILAFLNFTSAVLEEGHSGDTITIQELRSDVTKMSTLSTPERRALVRLIDAIDAAT